MKREKYITKVIFMTVLSIFLSACSSPIIKKDDDDGVIVRDDRMGINLAIDRVDTLNPLMTRSESVSDCMQLVFEPLFTYDGSMTPVPVLAESITASEDALSYTLILKNGVYWHDGSPLSANDVVHTINLIRYNESRYTKLLSCIGSVSAADDRTVIISLQRAVPNFAALLGFPIVKDGTGAEISEGFLPVGTGPYKYGGKSSSDRIKLLANENYHLSPPALPEVYLNVLKDKNAVINAFNAGELDAVTSELIDLGENTPSGDIYTKDYVSNNMIFVGYNCSEGIFANSETRKAVSYIIDRQDIVENELFSRAEAAYFPVNPSAWFSPKVSAAEYTDEYINEVLSLAGWQKDGDGYTKETEQYTDDSDEPETVIKKLSANIIVNDNNEERYRIAHRIADSLNAFGIDTDITVLDFEEYSARIARKDYSMFIGEVEMPNNMDSYSLLCGGDNFFSYTSSVMNDAVYAMSVAKTHEETEAAYFEFSNVFSEEMPFIPLLFRKASVIYKNSMAGTGDPNVFSAYTAPENWYVSMVRTRAAATEAEAEATFAADEQKQ